MANEIAVPLLPCASIDDMADFYEALGFRVTYRQARPNPYVAMQREDLHLHFFGMPSFEPADSYGTCVVLVPTSRRCTGRSPPGCARGTARCRWPASRG